MLRRTRGDKKWLNNNFHPRNRKEKKREKDEVVYVGGVRSGREGRRGVRVSHLAS